MTETSGRLVVLGHIARAHGVHGAVVVAAYTEDADIILAGRKLVLLPPPKSKEAPRPISSLKGKEAAQGLIVKIAGVATRDAAEALRGWALAIDRDELPPPEDGEVYIHDLMGLEAFTDAGEPIGRVDNFMETGAGLIIAVTAPDGREILVPFNDAFIGEVDLEAGRLTIIPIPGLLDTE